MIREALIRLYCTTIPHPRASLLHLCHCSVPHIHKSRAHQRLWLLKVAEVRKCRTREDSQSDEMKTPLFLVKRREKSIDVLFPPPET